MKLLVADVSREGTSIHKVLVEEGKYFYIRKLEGDFNEQAEQIILITLNQRPNKVIVEEIGIGKGLLDTIIKKFSLCGLKLKDDGTVVYE
jgi:hypothetical protein